MDISKLVKDKDCYQGRSFVSDFLHLYVATESSVIWEEWFESETRSSMLRCELKAVKETAVKS